MCCGSVLAELPLIALDLRAVISSRVPGIEESCVPVVPTASLYYSRAMSWAGRMALPLALKTVVILINNNGHKDSRFFASKFGFQHSREQRLQNDSRRVVKVRQPRHGSGGEDGNHHHLFR